MAKYDFLLKNGYVFDENKKDFISADVGIKADKIKKIGKLEEKDAAETIDASGKYVCPGFIDITNHSDTFWTLFSDPYQQSLLSQGITTILGGNCGSSLAPLVSPRAIEGIQKWTDITKINIDWQTVREFLKGLEKHKMGLNFATLVGHGTLRRGVIGNETRKASRPEMSEIKMLIEQAMREGAFGLSFNLGAAHESGANEEELTAFSEIVKKNGGVAKHHLEDEGKNILPSIVHLINCARHSGVKTHISHFKAIGKTAWDKFKESLFLIENAIKDGAQFTLDVFPYNRTGSSLYSFLPEWVKRDGKEKILDLIKNKEERKQIIEYFKSLTLHYDKITISAALRDKNVLGKTIKQLSEETGLGSEEIILNLIDLNEINVSIFNEAIQENHIDELIKKPFVIIATDGAGYDIIKESGLRQTIDFNGPKDLKDYNLVHPRSFGSFPKALKNFALDRSVITFGEAVFKMSSFPAKFLGLTGRGCVRENYFADISVINPYALAAKADYENPFQLSSGVEFLFVSGEPAIKNGKFTFKRNGKVLRKK